VAAGTLHVESIQNYNARLKGAAASAEAAGTVDAGTVDAVGEAA